MPSACCSRASSTCRWCSTSTTTRSPRPTASRSCRSCPTAASSSTATAWCSRPTTRPTRSRSRRARSTTSSARSTSSPTLVEITPRDRRRFKKLLEESKSFESLPIRTRLTDEEIARFAANRYRFPGVDDQGAALPPVSAGRGRLARDRPHRAHQRGRREAHRGRRAHLQLPRHRLHRQDRPRGQLRDASCTAPPASSRSRSTPAGARSARCRATTPISGNNLVLKLDLELQEVAEDAFGDRRGALVAIEPDDRRRAGVRQQARLRPQPLRRRHRPAELERAQQLARQADDQPRAARARIRRARPSSRSWRSRRSSYGKRTPEPGDLRSRVLQLRRTTASATTRSAATASVDMYKSIVVSCDTYYYDLANDLGIDAHPRFMGAVRLRPPHRHRHRGRVAGRAAFAGVEAEALQASRSGTPARRSASASARATTRTRRCSSPPRPPRSPTTA